jgi:hypothetical protein
MRCSCPGSHSLLLDNVSSITRCCCSLLLPSVACAAAQHRHRGDGRGGHRDHQLRQHRAKRPGPCYPLAPGREREECSPRLRVRRAPVGAKTQPAQHTTHTIVGSPVCEGGLAPCHPPSPGGAHGGSFAPGAPGLLSCCGYRSSTRMRVSKARHPWSILGMPLAYPWGTLRQQGVSPARRIPGVAGLRQQGVSQG